MHVVAGQKNSHSLFGKLLYFSIFTTVFYNYLTFAFHAMEDLISTVFSCLSFSLFFRKILIPFTRVFFKPFFASVIWMTILYKFLYVYIYIYIYILYTYIYVCIYIYIYISKQLYIKVISKKQDAVDYVLIKNHIFISNKYYHSFT